MTPGAKRKRAGRIKSVVEYLYWTGRIEWGHRWAEEWHKLASDLNRNHNINIYTA